MILGQETALLVKWRKQEAANLGDSCWISLSHKAVRDALELCSPEVDRGGRTLSRAGGVFVGMVF